MRALAAALALLLGLALAGSAHAQISRRLDRTEYSIHVDVASQLDLAELRAHLAEAERLLQRDQGGSDVACCMSLEATSLVVFGAPGDGLDVIDDPADWDALGNRRAIVQTLNWCGSTPGNYLGCAYTPGDKLVVALDAGVDVLPILLAHERGHNANLAHRDSPCALMAPRVSDGNGCLNAGECTMYRAHWNATTSGSCECMGAAVGDPVRPDGSTCGSGTCSGGVCELPPDGDGDGVADAGDNCAEWPNTAQADVDGNGIGDACECGDQDGNGRVGSPDLVAINLATFDASLVTPLCDTDNDDVCSVRDIVGANRKIFGVPAYCARYPPPGP